MASFGNHSQEYSTDNKSHAAPSGPVSTFDSQPSNHGSTQKYVREAVNPETADTALTGQGSEYAPPSGTTQGSYVPTGVSTQQYTTGSTGYNTGVQVPADYTTSSQQYTTGSSNQGQQYSSHGSSGQQGELPTTYGSQAQSKQAQYTSNPNDFARGDNYKPEAPAAAHQQDRRFDDETYDIDNQAATGHGTAGMPGAQGAAGSFSGGHQSSSSGQQAVPDNAGPNPRGALSGRADENYGPGTTSTGQPAAGGNAPHAQESMKPSATGTSGPTTMSGTDSSHPGQSGLTTGGGVAPGEAFASVGAPPHDNKPQHQDKHQGSGNPLDDPKDQEDVPKGHGLSHDEIKPSSGTAADGGDFDAAKPGAGYQAILLEEKMGGFTNSDKPAEGDHNGESTESKAKKIGEDVAAKHGTHPSKGESQVEHKKKVAGETADRMQDETEDGKKVGLLQKIKNII